MDDQDEFTAYHGSPHDFEQFDLSKIGTGEGAQAYGHGLYFAENEDVASNYRDRVSRGRNVVAWYDRTSGNRVEVPDLISNDIADFMNANGSDLRSGDFDHKSANFRRWAKERTEKQIPEFEEALRNAQPEHVEWLTQAVKDLHGDVERYNAAADFLDKHRPRPVGRMYEVTIKAHPDHFLDWDKPLVEQPHILNAIDEHLGDPEVVMDQLFGNREAIGRDLHDKLGGGYKKEAVSQRLLEMGIPGIKYFDQGSRGSRGSKEGTRNYVVFDAKLVSVKKKYADGGSVDEDGDLTAYHGSPHDFERFDLSKVGTGQGEQAFGHGLYFASNEDVAKSYRDDLSSGKQVLDDRPVEDLAREGLMADEPSPDQQIARYVNQYGRMARNAMSATAPHLLDRYDELVGGERLKPAGKMYEVRIKAHPETILDWDKPIAEQPRIMAMLNEQHANLDPEHEMFEHLNRAHKNIMEEGARGSHAHYYLKTTLGNKGASDYLNGMGIKGIKYLDRGSRGVGEGSHNYVIFDDSLVNVARKYRHGGSVPGYAEGGGVDDDVPYHQTPEFQNWFGDSVTHNDGVPITYYHGTSKDKDFPSFNVGRHGLWMTSNPSVASEYAKQNDSQNYRYDGNRFISTNTASRVIPVHFKAENPYTGSMPNDFLNDNYKKGQSDFFDYLRSKGHDSWIPAEYNGELAVALKDPTQLKSIYNRTFDPKNKRMDKDAGGSVDIPNIDNAVSVFPKPQRMFPESAPVAGGQYLNAATKEDMTGHKAAMASIGVELGGKPYFKASPESVEETGSPGPGSAIAKTNLFKQKAGWRWMQAPEGHENTNTIVSVEHRGKHHYALNAHFPKGVDFTRYENAPSEPRLRPTTRGNVELGPQVGSISVRGKEHPVYEHVIVKTSGGEVSGGSAVSTLRRMSNPAVSEAIRVIMKSGSSPRDAVTLSKRLLGRQ